MSDAISVGSSIALTIITGIYVVLTAKALKLNRSAIKVMVDQHEASTRPYVVISPFADRGQPLIKLRVQNLGNSAARRLSLKLDRNFYRFGKEDENLAEAPLFSKTTDHFAPHAEFIFLLAVSYQLFDPKNADRTPLELSVLATYESPAGQHYSETTAIDFNMFRQTGVNPDALTAEMKELTKAVEGVGDALRSTMR